MSNHVVTAEQRLKKVFSPILTAAAFSALLAGCGSAPTPEPVMPETPVPSSEATMPVEGSASSDTTSTSEGMMSSPAMQTSLYKDGSYDADGAYRSPAGGEAVHVSLSIKGDKVVDAAFSATSPNKKSQHFIDQFSAGFKEQVVGKSLDEVNVDVVNGSSLTGIGFNDAVTKIKAQAKA